MTDEAESTASRARGAALVDASEILRAVQAVSRIDTRALLASMQAAARIDTRKVLASMQAAARIDTGGILSAVRAVSRIDTDAMLASMQAVARINADEMLRAVRAVSRIDTDAMLASMQAAARINADEMLRAVQAMSRIDTDAVMAAIGAALRVQMPLLRLLPESDAGMIRSEGERENPKSDEASGISKREWDVLCLLVQFVVYTVVLYCFLSAGNSSGDVQVIAQVLADLGLSDVIAPVPAALAARSLFRKIYPRPT